MATSKYSTVVMEKVRRFYGYSKDDTSIDAVINKMSKDEVFDCVLAWDGLQGWRPYIQDYIEGIYGVKLKN